MPSGSRKAAKHPAPPDAGRFTVLFDASKGGPGATKNAGWLRERAVSMMAKLLKSPAELSLTLVRDRQIRVLKKRWFGVDAATDVLSFPSGDVPENWPGPRPLGDIVISLDTARRAAKALETSFEHELALYLAHGLLHLLGYDHQTRAQARAMARKERLLLGAAGMLERSDEA